MSGFEKLVIYKKSLRGVKLIYSITSRENICKDYSLKDQIKRASYSVSANIAEGYGRTGRKSRKQFLSYSIGSSNEVIAFLDIISIVYPKISTRKEKEYYEYLGKQIYLFRKNLIDD